MSSSFLYEKALSLEWNGQVFVLTVRKETPASPYGYLYSYDGINWTTGNDLSGSALLTNNNPYNIRWTGTNYAMIGNLTTSQGNVILRSNDGFNYSVVNTAGNYIPPLYDLEVNAEYPHTITFPKNTTLALGGVANDTNKIIYSLDNGTTWIASSNSAAVFSTSANAACWNGKLWVGVGTGTGNTIATSKDGNTWVGRGSYIFTTAGYSITWAKEQKQWLAGGTGTNSLAYSYDGVYWIGTGSSILSTVYDVKWNGILWVAAGTPISGGTKSLAYSYDARNWYYPTQTNLFDLSATAVAWNGTFWIAIGNSSASNQYYNLAISTNGINWQMKTDISSVTVFTSIYSNPKRTNTTLLTDSSNNLFVTTNNNLNFSKNGMFVTTTGNTLNSSFYNGTNYFVGGNTIIQFNNITAQSTTTTVPPNITSIKNFAWNNPDQGNPSIQPITVALGQGNNTLATSTDGIYWKGFGDSVFSVRGNHAVWNGLLWVAVGTGNYWVSSSYDGVTWTGRDNYLMQEAYDVAWNGSFFVAVGYGISNMCISRDGIVWYGIPNANSFFPTYASAIIWTGQSWIAYGSGGTSTTAYCNSPDAWSWSYTSTPSLAITSATSALLSPGFNSLDASSSYLISSYPPSNAFDNSLNIASSTDWKSISAYNAAGTYNGFTTTTYNQTLTVSGEWIQIKLTSPIKIKYYQLSWYLYNTNLTPITNFYSISFGSSNSGYGLSSAANYAYTTGTAEIWFQTSVNQPGYATLISKQNAFSLYLYNNVLVAYDWTTQTAKSSGVTVNDGVWHCATFSFNSGVNNGSFLYLDGSLKSTFTYTISDETFPLTIAYNSGLGQYFNGYISQTRLWNRQLTPTEILSFYNINIPLTTTGLTGLWNFTDGSGTSISNAISGGPSLSYTKASATNFYSLQLNGTNQGCDIGNATYYAYTVGTVECWFRTTANQSFVAILSKQFQWGLFISNNTLTAYDWSGRGVLGSGGSTINDGNWHHALFSYNSGVTNGSYIYLDGVLQTTCTFTNQNISGDSMKIGYNAGIQYFNGNILQVRVWNRQLSSTEITNYYNQIIPATTSGLTGYWQFTDGSGSTLINSVSGGYNFTLSNSPVWSSNIPSLFSNSVWTSGVIPSIYNTTAQVPSKWMLLGSNDSATWGLLDSFQFNTPTPPTQGKYPFFVKLQNTFNNTTPYQYYRVVFPSLFSGGNTAYISEIDFFQTNSNSNVLSPYLKPILTRTHVLHPTQIVRFSSSVGPQTLYVITDLSANLIGNCYVNNGYYTNNILVGAGSNIITASCFDGQNLITTSMNGNISILNNQSLNTNLQFDVSFNGNTLLSQMGGNIYAACFNGKRIILGGSGGNVITYNTLSTVSGAGSSTWNPSINASGMFSTVFGLASNPGYGFINPPNTIYFSPGERVSIVAPKYYNQNITSLNNITIGINTANLIQSVVLPTASVITYYLGPTGAAGPMGNMPNGPVGGVGFAGPTGCLGPTGSAGPTGTMGCTPDSPKGYTGQTGTAGTCGTIGQNGPLGQLGCTGQTGTAGQTGCTGYEGPLQMDGWNYAYSQRDIYLTGNMKIGNSQNNSSISVIGNININQQLLTNDEHAQTITVSNSVSIGGNQRGSLSVYGNANIKGQTTNSQSVYAKHIYINQTVYPISIPTYNDSSTISINTSTNSYYYIDIGNSGILSNFTSNLENFTVSQHTNKIYHITLVLDYVNVILPPSPSQFYCNHFSIQGTTYDINFTGGNPTIPSSVKKIIQSFDIIITDSTIRKILCNHKVFSS